ncbi:MAG: hypothetical protein IJR58_02645 [Lachnospiraceae bacterium]|nr:hypothetical protein [Lachnospiraceae bacterium]
MCYETTGNNRRLVFFAFFLIFALGAFLSGGILSGIFFLILAVLCSPLRKKIFEFLPDGVNRIPVKIGAGVLAFILSIGLFPESEITETPSQDVAVTAEESTADTVNTEQNRAAELAAKEAEKKAAEEAEREAAEAAEAERKAQEEAAVREAERKAQEEAAAKEAERKAQEEAAAKEAERKAQEEAAAKEAERKAQEEATSAEQFQINQPSPGEVAQERSVQPVMNAGGGGGDASNFDTYNNVEQQQTSEAYVLNTNPSSMKIHYPGCRYVPKISPENYATSNETLSTLESRGYSRCGVCMK